MEAKHCEVVDERVRKFMQAHHWSPRSSKYQSPSLTSSPSKPGINSPLCCGLLSPPHLRRRLFSPRQKPNVLLINPSEVPYVQQSSPSDKAEGVKNRIKNVMRRMKYKDKLTHLECIIEQARSMSNKHGHFYITTAMFEFRPESEIKLKLWIPNVHEAKCLHAIKEGDGAEREKYFYTSLKTALRELFPTISLGDGLNYTSIVTHIRDLRKDLTARLQKSPAGKVDPDTSTPGEYGLLTRHNSSKIVKVSRLVDFREGISVIEEDTEEVSLIQVHKKREVTKGPIKKSKPSEETKASKPMTHRYSYRWTPSAQPFESSLSNLLKEDEGEFTLADSKLRSNTSRIKLTHNIATEMKKLLLN